MAVSFVNVFLVTSELLRSGVGLSTVEQSKFFIGAIFTRFLTSFNWTPKGARTLAIGCGCQEVHMLESIFHGCVQSKLERRLTQLESMLGVLVQCFFCLHSRLEGLSLC